MAPAARTAAWLSTTLLCIALLPGVAQATHQNRWQDGGAGAPTSASLKDVAAHGASGVVVVVGEDAASGQALILRRAGETWVEDQINLPGALGSELKAVAVTQSAALAVGSYQDAGGSTQPLVLRVNGGEPALTSATSATWSAPAGALPAGVQPRGVALRGTEGLIGTGTTSAYPRGAVYRYDDSAGIGTELTPSAPAPPAGPVNSIAFYADGKAYAGAEMPSDDPANPADGGSSRIFRIDLVAPGGPQMLPVSVSAAEDPMLPILGVSAFNEDTAVAIEGNPSGDEDPDTWSPTEAIWSRDDAGDDFTAASRPRDVSLQPSGGSPSGAIVGTYNGLPAYWRGGPGNWNLNTGFGADGALNGVVQLDYDDIWAVGENGTILHYGPAPDLPPDTSIDSGPVGETTQTTATFGFSSLETGVTFKCSLDGASYTDCTSPKTYPGLALGQHTFRVRAVGLGGEDPTPAERTFTIVAPQQPPPGGSGGSGLPVVQPSNSQCKNVPRPLLRNVVVRKRTGRLEIEFDAAAAVRVEAQAYHRNALIGRTRERVLNPGHHQLALRYGRKKGKPTRLKMLASPADSDACP